MLKISESLVGFTEESAVSPGKVENLTREILNSYHQLRKAKQRYVPPKEEPASE